MSEKEFELYLSLLGRFLKLDASQRDEIADELRDHLEARLEELSRTGLARDDAIRTALEEFGDAAELAQHFTQLAKRRQRRFLMRCTFATVAGLTLAILLTSAFWPGSQHGPIPLPALADELNDAKQLPDAITRGISADARDSEQNQVVQTKLDSLIENFKFDGTPLKEALEAIGERVGVDILLDDKSLSENGVTADDLVSFELKHTKLSAAAQLRLILEKLNLAYRIQDGLVMVESRGKVTVRVYNCRDLLAKFQQSVNLSRAYEGEGLFAKVDVVTAADAKSTAADEKKSAAAAPKQQNPAQVLIDVLASFSNGNWEQTHGEGGAIFEYNGLLIVSNDEEGQRGIQKMLKVLREADSLNVPQSK